MSVHKVASGEFSKNELILTFNFKILTLSVTVDLKKVNKLHY